MHYKTLTALFALATLANATPFNLVKRTPDGTCGGANGYICDAGYCCSQYGWCGAGCQPAFGSCSGSGGTTTSKTTTSTPTTTKTTTTTPTSTPTGRAKVGSVPYGTPISTCRIPGVVAITFDDGPYIYTNKLLDMLKSKGAKATFFVNGQNWGDNIMVYNNRNRINRMRYEGHQIGSHTYTHPDLSTLSYSQIQSEMLQLETPLLSIIGKYPTYMRPPYLSCSGACPGALNDLGYHIINTDLDTQDWANQGNIQVSKDIYKYAIDSRGLGDLGFVVLAHDVHEQTVSSLAAYMIDYARSKGWRLVTVGECMGDPSSNWYRTQQ